MRSMKLNAGREKGPWPLEASRLLWVKCAGWIIYRQRVQGKLRAVCVGEVNARDRSCVDGDFRIGRGDVAVGGVREGV